jgi:hypothetical protein
MSHNFDFVGAAKAQIGHFIIAVSEGFAKTASQHESHK